MPGSTATLTVVGFLTMRVKFCPDAGATPFDAVMTSGYFLAFVPFAGVPASVAVPSWLSVNVTPDGSGPAWLKLMADPPGKPLAFRRVEHGEGDRAFTDG